MNSRHGTRDAGDSHTANAWADDLYRRARDRGHDHPHAVGILARAWLQVIWRRWQDQVPYDQPTTEHCNASWQPRLDTGLLMPRVALYPRLERCYSTQLEDQGDSGDEHVTAG